MRDLTRFECGVIAGGEVNTHIVIPTQPMTNEQALVAVGFISGISGAAFGAAVGLSYGGPAIIGCAAAGAVISAFGLPYAFHTISNGLLAGYKALGMIE